jgi:hypothetical protein
MITGCYLPTWCKLDLDDGRTVNALVFIMDPRHPLFEADTSAQVIAPLIARQRAAWHQRSVSVLARSGAAQTRMHDACDDLVGKVRHLLGKQPARAGLDRPGFPGRLLSGGNVADGVLQRLAVAVDENVPGAAVRHGQIRAILHAQNIRMTIARHFGAHQVNMAAFGTTHHHVSPPNNVKLAFTIAI